MAQPPGPKRHIVIVGGGIIGSTTAYFLTRHPKYDPSLHRITLLEATSSIAAGASGKAGGLLALWAYPAELVPLSYRLHRELALEHNGAQRWGYRRVGCGHVQAKITMADLERRAVEVTAIQQQQAEKQAEKQTEKQTEDKIKTAPELQLDPHEEQKEWEKLPKQDEHAARLLSDPLPVLPADLDYVDGAVAEYYQQMGSSPETHETAQVHPMHFTQAMAALAAERGVEVRLSAQVTRIVTGNKGSDEAVEAVEYRDRSGEDGNEKDGDEKNGSVCRIDDVTDVVVSAGPWTGVVLPRTKVGGLRAHSVVWEAEVAPYAVFTDIALPADYVPKHRAAVSGGKGGRHHIGHVDPEIYARPFGEVYACGEPDTRVPLPPTADAVTVDEVQCADIEAYVGTLSSALAAAPVKTRQACYLPRHIRFGDERGPLIGLTRTRGVYVAAGHTCWGIQNGPGTGCLMAELLLDGKATSADISRLDPTRFKV